VTTDLRYLACTAILTAALWIPYVVAQMATNPTVPISMPWSVLPPSQHS